MDASTPENVAMQATRGLDDALDWLRYPDWVPGHEPSREQVKALRTAQRLTAEAKAALEGVVRAANVRRDKEN